MAKAWPVPGVDPVASVPLNARRILAVRVAELYSWTPVIPHPEAIEPLHALRISAKRLRYTLELFGDDFGDDGARAIVQIREVQELLGTLHDIDVRIDLIEDELASTSLEHARLLGPRLAASDSSERQSIVSSALRPPPDDPRRGLVSLLSRQHEQRQGQYRRFVDRWSALQVEGMRSRLVRLSSPLEVIPTDVEALVEIHRTKESDA
jgi:hypothetical protein